MVIIFIAHLLVIFSFAFAFCFILDMSEDLINSLVRKYLAGAPLTDFDFDKLLSLIDEKRLVEVAIASPLTRKYPLASGYRLRFLRKLLDSTSVSDELELDELYTAYGRLLSEAKTDSNGISHKIYVGKFDELNCPRDFVIIRQSDAIISGGTTGLSIWQGCQDLFRFLHANREIFKGKNLLELGSGLGLAGLLALKSGLQCGFLFSDCHGQVLDFLQWNFEENLGRQMETRCVEDLDFSAGVKFLRLTDSPDKHSCGILELDWRCVDRTAVDWLVSHFPIDFIVASDVSYDSTLIPHLCQTLQLLISRSTSQSAHVVHCIRNEETLEVFKAQLYAVGLAISETKITLTDTGDFYLPQLPNSSNVVILTITADKSHLADVMSLLSV